MKKVLIAGGSGFLGTHLIAELKKLNYKVIVLSRNKSKSEKILNYADEVIQWDYKTKSKELVQIIEGLSAVINLSGRNIFQGRWTENHIKEIQESRIIPTRILAEAVSEAVNKPDVFINASAIGYYGIDYSTMKNENSPPGNDFLANLCKQWENALQPAKLSGIRTIPIRFGIITSSSGGALQRILLTKKFRVIFLPGTGKQTVSYIKLENAVALLIKVLQNNQINEPINAVEQEPITFKELVSNYLENQWYLTIPVPELIFKIALGEGYVYLTRSVNVTTIY